MFKYAFLKKSAHKLYLFFFKKRWTACCAFFLAAFSCNHKKVNNNHAAYLEKVVDTAYCMVDQHKLNDAFNYFDRHYNLIVNPAIGDQLKKYGFKQAASYVIAKIDNDKSKFFISMAYADSMLNIIHNNKAENSFRYDDAVAHFGKGDVLFEQGRYDEAYQYFYKGKLLADKLENSCSRALFNDRFALLCFKQHKYSQAAALFLLAYKERLGCSIDFKNFAATQGSINNAGLSYVRENMADSAINCFQTALTYLDQTAGKFRSHQRFVMDAYGVTYGHLGWAYQDRGEFAEAEACYNKSTALNSHSENEAGNNQTVQLRLAHIYLETHRFHELDLLVKNIRASLDTLQNNRAELEWQKLNWNFLMAMNQPQKARPHLMKYLRLKDSADAVDRKIASADAGSSFLNLQQDYDLEILKEQNKLSSVYLFFTIGFSVLALFAIFQVWRNWRISKKSNNDLTALNSAIVERNLTLQRALNALEQSQEENTNIMKVVAHDLRSPIGAIVSLADLVMQSGSLSIDDKEMIGLIQTSGSNSLKFINELLNRESAAKALKTEEVNLGELLANCVAQLQLRANEKQQRIILKSEPVLVRLNREKMWRVFSNLVTNSIKFSAGGANIEVRVEVKTDTVLIAVKDSGIGIPDELKDKIFNMVSKAKREGTDGEKSFGLGLAISRQIVEAHDGKLWFESQAKQGVTFYVELPINQVP